MHISYNNKYNYIITDDNENIKILKEPEDYSIVYTDDTIDDLINWISETKNYSDEILMKVDLKMLLNIKDDYIFSSNLTNEYIIKSLDEESFNNLCNEFISLNK